MKKRFITIIISITSLYIIVSLSQSIYTLWQKGGIVKEEETVLAQKRQENEKLKQQLQEVQSPEFIEKTAREKLNLQKEGETVVVLPKIQISDLNDQKTEEKLSNWQKWWKILF